MIIIVNGEKQKIDKPSISIAELLQLNKVEMPEMVSVQLNQRFVDRNDYPSTQLKEGDEVDFLYFMGGGER